MRVVLACPNLHERPRSLPNGDRQERAYAQRKVVAQAAKGSPILLSSSLSLSVPPSAPSCFFYPLTLPHRLLPPLFAAATADSRSARR